MTLIAGPKIHIIVEPTKHFAVILSFEILYDKDEPLMSELPAKGQIVKETENTVLGFKELNDSRLNVSRVLNQLQYEGLVELHRGRVVIPQLERLMQA